MIPRELLKSDLNLLISLQVLLEERSVSRAAERLNITQPAMSKTLSRLREMFDDPLFTRASHGMQPTPRAEALAATLAQLLADIGQLVTGSDFDPYAYTGEVTIALSEYVGATLLPGLVEKLHQRAPRLSIRTITRVENQLEQLAKGSLDFAIHIEQSHYGDDYDCQPLGGSPPAIMVRDSHPLCQGEVTWSRLANYPVIQLYISDLDQARIAESSEAFFRSRNPQQGSFETSHLLTALEVLRHTDYYMPAPAYLMQNPAASAGITALPSPDAASYSMDYVLVRHRRTANSALHNWLWGQLLDHLAELGGEMAAVADL